MRHKGIFCSEAPLESQVISMKFHLSHVSRRVPEKQLMAFKHSGLQHVHVPDLDQTNTYSTYYTVVSPLSFCVSMLIQEVCVHHDVCRLGVGGVETNVQRLDLDLHGGRSIDEDPAAVVSVGSCWIPKDATRRKQLNVTICWAEI